MLIFSHLVKQFYFLHFRGTRSFFTRVLKDHIIILFFARQIQSNCFLKIRFTVHRSLTTKTTQTYNDQFLVSQKRVKPAVTTSQTSQLFNCAVEPRKMKQTSLSTTCSGNTTYFAVLFLWFITHCSNELYPLFQINKGKNTEISARGDYSVFCRD